MLPAASDSHHSIAGGEIRRVVTESVIPFFKTMLLSKNLGKGFAASGLPMDIILDEYDPFNDYLEMVMQFGVSFSLL